MDLATTTAGRRALRGTAWPAAARTFFGSIRAGGQRPGRLLTVGTEAYEPWHLVAHLADAARLYGEPALAPTLLRRSLDSADPRTPAHLRHGLADLERAGRGETVLVVTPLPADDELLSRVEDARARGSLVLAMTPGDRALTGLAHDALVTGHRGDPIAAPFELMSHLVALGTPAGLSRWRPNRRSAATLVGAR